MPRSNPPSSLLALSPRQPAWMVNEPESIAAAGTGEPCDQELVRQTLAGDPNAFEALVLRYERPIYVHLLKMTGGRPEDAEDLTQETFIRALRGLATFRPRQSFRPWLYRVATNTAISSLRRRGPVMVSLDGDGDGHPLEIADAHAESPVEKLGRAEMLAQLEEAVAALPAEGAALVNLRYREGLSFEEIGKVLGRKPGSVAVMMHRIRKRLREMVFG